jgi:hypothetical protein
MIAAWVKDPIVTAPTARMHPSALPVTVHNELIGLALETLPRVLASWESRGGERSTPSDKDTQERATLLMKIAWELDRADRSGEALSVFHMAPSPVDAVRATSGMAVFAAEALLPFIDLAERAGDSALAAGLLSSAKTLLREERETIEDTLGPARSVARVSERVGDKETARWLGSLSGMAGLTLALQQLEDLRRASDPQWELLFDQIEERLESNENQRVHHYAAKAFLRCDLGRAAYRHWARGGKWIDTDLLAALWRADFESGYRSVVENLCVHWANGDWSAVSTLVDVALTQAFAGDSAGAERTASEAHRVAEDGAREILESARGRPPEVAVWSLAHLIPLDVGRAQESRATETLARCRALLKAKAPGPVGKSWRRSRETTMISLVQSCSEAGWAKASLEFGAGSYSLAQALCMESSSGELRRWADLLPAPRERLEFLLNVCRRMPDKPRRDPEKSSLA